MTDEGPQLGTVKLTRKYLDIPRGYEAEIEGYVDQRGVLISVPSRQVGQAPAYIPKPEHCYVPWEFVKITPGPLGPPPIARR